MQVLIDYFNPNNSIAIAERTEKRNQKWLNFALVILSQGSVELNQVYMIEKRLAELKISPDHPVAKKVEALHIKHPNLKHLLSNKLDNNRGLLTASLSNLNTVAKNIPPIPGDTLNVKCSLDTIKLIVFFKKGTLREIVLHDVDDEVLSSIATYCPNLETLRIQAANTVCFDFTDAGVKSIAKLEKLKVLEINVMFAPLYEESFSVLLSSSALKNGLHELTLHTGGLSDVDHLPLIASYKTLKSLEFLIRGESNHALLSLFQSTTLKTTLQKIKIVTPADFSAITIDDAMLTALSSYKDIQTIDLGPQWHVTEPHLIKCLDAMKNISTLFLRGLSLSPATAAKIGEMGVLSSLELTDCSKLSSENFWNLLDNKANLFRMDLRNTDGLYNSEKNATFDKLAHLSKLSVLSLSDGCLRDEDLIKFSTTSEMKQHLSELYLTNLLYTHGRALGSIGNLGALTVLRVDNCRFFNDDSLKAVYETPLKDRLISLQLKDVAITERSFKFINDSNSLKKLILADCFAITHEGLVQFFNAANLQKNLTTLALANFQFPDEMVSKIDAFVSLEWLYLFNNESITDKGRDILHEREKNSGGAFKAGIFLGDLDYCDMNGF